MPQISIDLPDELPDNLVAAIGAILEKTLSDLSQAGLTCAQISMALTALSQQLDELSPDEDPVTRQRTIALTAGNAALFDPATLIRNVSFETTIEGAEDELENEISNDDIDFDDMPEIKAIERLCKRIDADLDRNVDQRVEIAEKALDLLAAARRAICRQATERGIEIQPGLRQWRQGASDEDLDREDEIVFLDNLHHLNTDTIWHQVETSIRAAAIARRTDLLLRIAEKIAGYSVDGGMEPASDTSIGDLPIDFQFADELEAALNAIKTYPAIVEAMRSGTEAAPIPLSRLREESGIDEDIFDSWLDQEILTGHVRRQKRAGRWVLVGSGKIDPTSC